MITAFLCGDFVPDKEYFDEDDSAIRHFYSSIKYKEWRREVIWKLGESRKLRPNFIPSLLILSLFLSLFLSIYLSISLSFFVYVIL